jgi:hypothetical protein
MTGADGGAVPGWRWDVALSFAGAQRDYVEQVAQALQARGVRCFYDADEQIELWGKYLAEELPVIYGEQAAAVVVFVSAEYAARDWTRHERRAALARAVRERQEYVLPARFDDTPLPGLLPDVSYIDLRTKTPQQFADMIADKLAILGIAVPDASADAGNLALKPEATRPAGAVRAGGADQRLLGVHAAISLPGVPDEVPPEYVLRDVDVAEHGVRAKVVTAAKRGGFVLLVGGSSVGKTRCAAEAVKSLLPDWWLVHPAGPTQVAALAHAPTRQTVVWLDELQRYLDGEHGLTGAVVRALLQAPHPTVLIGTLWPDRYIIYTAVPPSGADPHARERQVLDLADVVRIGPAFSPAEQDRARAAAVRDPRLRVALEQPGYGPTQTLAAAPQLVARWEDAQTGSPYAWAVLTAALDTARLGARSPLSTDFLRAAAPGYCTSAQQAEAPDNWFEEALAYATGRLHGAVAALSPAGAGMGQIAGYAAADYLVQYASRIRHYERVPTSTWEAVLSHLHDLADAVRLGDSARNRLLYLYAIPLYRHGAEAGDLHAAGQQAMLLARRGDLDGAIQILRAWADARDGYAADLLADLLSKRGDLDELRARADAGDGHALYWLADLLSKRGDLDGLAAQADAGYEYAASRLAGLLAGRGDLAGLAARADAGDEPAADRLADLLADRGDVDGLRRRADAGERQAAARLAELLVGRGDLAGLAARADAGDEYAALRLADLLADRGDVDGLRRRADAGDGYAARQLAYLQADRDPLDTVRGWLDDDDAQAWLLAERGDMDGLQIRANAGHEYAARLLADLLADRGDLDEAIHTLRARADAGDGPTNYHLAELLVARGDIDAGAKILRVRADAGDKSAADRLADLLADRGDLDGLRARVDAGDEYAAERLPGLLIERGQDEEAEQLRRFGLNPDGSIACALGDVENGAARVSSTTAFKLSARPRLETNDSRHDQLLPVGHSDHGLRALKSVASRACLTIQRAPFLLQSPL